MQEGLVAARLLSGVRAPGRASPLGAETLVLPAQRGPCQGRHATACCRAPKQAPSQIHPFLSLCEANPPPLL